MGKAKGSGRGVDNCALARAALFCGIVFCASRAIAAEGRANPQPGGAVNIIELDVDQLAQVEVRSQGLPAAVASVSRTSEPAGGYDAANPQPAGAKTEAKGILDLDIEQLSKVEVRSQGLSMEVTSVSRTSEPIGKTPAAVYVVTNEMIRRCGARNIPEVLRTVPGVNVAQTASGTWAISMRGFNGRFANKLLVQIDGVAVYSPLQSGVFWEREPVMLEDVERIEVIRGPGGSLWGNNAVNGVINIVTKSSKDTKGVYADFGAGNEHKQFANVRAGGQTGDVTYRVWGSNTDDDAGYAPPPYVAIDYYRYAQGGFRADWAASSEDTITIQGDFVNGQSNFFGLTTPGGQNLPTDFTKATFLTRWQRTLDEDTDWQAQCYYYCPYGVSGSIEETNRNVDFDFQYHMNRGRHDIVWGCGYRNDEERQQFILGPFGNNKDSEQIPSYFAQDTITLVEDRVFVTFGSKFDNNTVTNFEYQPTAKLAYTPDDKTSIWGAITRAVRTPSIFERKNALNLESENVLAYELGYRRQSTEKLFWELATYYNQYEKLVGFSMFPFVFDNTGWGETYGAEFNATYAATERWRLTGSYSFCIERIVYETGYSPFLTPGATPRNQFYLQSGWDLGHDVTFDLMLRYVDSLAIGAGSYFVGDVRLAWRPRKNLEFSVVGQNLCNGKHYEFATAGGAATSPTEVEPGVFGMVSWRY